MKVIQFILNNWFVMIVLYFVISSLLKRGKGAATKGTSKTTGRAMPPFGGGGGKAGWDKKNPAMSKGKAAPVVPSHTDKAASERPKAAEPVRVSSPRQEMPASVPAKVHPAPSAVNQKMIERPSGQDLARGVIWAEILGPPRSKKPFRRL